MEERGWAYRRRRPEGTVLYEAVRDNLATLLEEASEVGRGLPRYVERDFARYLECGVLAHGFARVRCESCKDELLVAFSCKGRGVCPSCNAKRAQVTAVHLVERVLPHVPYRQWTLSFPHRVRWVLLKDVGLSPDDGTSSPKRERRRRAWRLKRWRDRKRGRSGQREWTGQGCYEGPSCWMCSPAYEAGGGRAILEHLGLPSAGARLAPARGPPQAAWC
ncbi:transposase zinc-binding domain-containing protein [Vitiosangium sp. GDMCC 1.1324]|uniref:transposase zinc-binding domain-containing protein n=1 Tax=Vitiosangium sp. (strain GDMCC 1.1324) TaxID=2138576 RepID=UPI001E617BE8|nr:transposase zinc-binding domain-containing protein [Vitiosangium sp. GDMCC 1.1324]